VVAASTGPVVTVFRSRLRPDAAARGYQQLASDMESLARSMPGFVDFKSFSAPDGERVSVITFDSIAHQHAWRLHPEHVAAQQRGREDFYDEYEIAVCMRVRHHRWRLPRAGLGNRSS